MKNNIMIDCYYGLHIVPSVYIQKYPCLAVLIYIYIMHICASVEAYIF